MPRKGLPDRHNVAFRPLAGVVHHFVLPAEQKDYRCGVCGTPWGRSPSGQIALGLTGSGIDQQLIGPESYFVCCQRAFKWKDGPEGGPITRIEKGEST